MTADLLAEPVTRFVEDLTPVLRELAASVPGIDLAKVPLDVATEAYHLVTAFIDCDGRQTDDELWALLGAFAGRFDTLLQYATPAQIRAGGLVQDRRAWLATPSLLFDLVVQTDRQRGTTWSHRYYDRAMALAHTVCAVDAVPSEDELRAVARFRTMLLQTMERAGVPKPGTPPQPATPGPPATGPAVAGAGAGAGPPPAPLPPARPLEALLHDLDALVGLDAVKAEVKLVTNLLRVQNLRRDRGLPVVETSRHLVFTGNPGTGKTTVARLLAQIYRSLGAVSRGQLVETDRSALVAGYVGQTAIRVREVFETALGGVLLIDEAYALARGGERDFGIEAIDALVKLMEDHRDEVAVIAAGYPEEMARFVASNPGLESRFPKTIFFPDYTTDELVRIFVAMCEANGYRCPDDTRVALQARFDAEPRDKGFGNARLARNLFEAAMGAHATRVVELAAPTDEDLSTLVPADVAAPVPP